MFVDPANGPGDRSCHPLAPKLFGIFYLVPGYFFLFWSVGALAVFSIWWKCLGAIALFVGMLCLAHGFLILNRLNFSNFTPSSSSAARQANRNVAVCADRRNPGKANLGAAVAGGEIPHAWTVPTDPARMAYWSLPLNAMPCK